MAQCFLVNRQRAVTNGEVSNGAGPQGQFEVIAFCGGNFMRFSGGFYIIYS